MANEEINYEVLAGGYHWSAILNEKRLKGLYFRSAKIVGKNPMVIEIKTEKGRITMTLGEMKNIVKTFEVFD